MQPPPTHYVTDRATRAHVRVTGFVQNCSMGSLLALYGSTNCSMRFFQTIFCLLSSLPVDTRKYIHFFEKKHNVLYVWGLMICVTFDNMGKTVYSAKDYNFLESQALASTKYILARVTFLLSFDT